MSHNHKYDQDFVFIAGSRDVKPGRERVLEIVNEQFALAGLHGISAYAWDYDPDITGHGFDPRHSMQDNLPRPSASNCRAVLCLFGERIGRPLEDGFDVQQIANLERWTNPGHPYRLVHPWPHSEHDANALLKAGAYPLTGTVFEFLSAHGVERLPLWIALFADERITESTPDVVLNGKRYFQQLTAGLGQDATARVAADGEYFRQTCGVRNFMLALDRQSIAPRLVRLDTPDFDCAVRSFLSNLIGKQAKQGNPYRKLNYYDIEDGEHFVGRGDFIAEAVRVLREGRIVRIVGPSGSGKSSVLRAGILRHFHEAPQERGRSACLALRPEDFHDPSGHVMPVIGTLLDLLTLRTGLELPPREVAKLRRKGAEAPALAVELIRSVLASAEGPSRLIIGLDQFEEIVDDLADSRVGDEWRPLITFVNDAETANAADTANDAATTALVRFVYTLESSRCAAHEKLDLGPAFRGAVPLALDDSSSTFINAVISEPFRKARLALATDLVQWIHAQFDNIRARDEPDARGAALPLLSLYLTRLFSLIENRFARSFEVSDAGGALRSATHAGARADPDGRSGISLRDLNEARVKVEFDDVIVSQAERAWKQATGSDAIDDLDLDQFLQPLVGTRNARPQIRTILNAFAYDGHQKIADAFVGARLLTTVTDGAVRLVHDAVIERWPAARRWFETRQEFLAMKEKLYRADLESIPSSPTEAQIDQAAEVLAAHLRTWSWPNARLTPPDEEMRAYCLAVFRASRTPMRSVSAFPANRTHVAVAAEYGLADLLDTFAAIDRDCIDCPEPGSQTQRRPLNHAAWGHLGAVELLLKLGVDPIATDMDGWPAIAGAIQIDARTICHAILERASQRVGIDQIEHVMGCPAGQTLLHLCALSNRHELAEMLITVYGFNPRAVDENGWTPLHHAASSGHEEAFALFAKYIPLSHLSRHKETVLHLAARWGTAELVSLILERDSRLAHAKDARGETPLHAAASQCKPASASALLKLSDPNEKNGQGKNVLEVAVAASDAQSNEESKLAVVAALLEDGRTNPNEIDLEKLDRPLLELLLKDGRLDLRRIRAGEPLFFLLARWRKWGEFERFLKTNRPHALQVNGRRNETLLHCLAAEHAPLNLVKRLLEDTEHARLEVQDDQGYTVLDAAILRKNWDLAENLLGRPGISLTLNTENAVGTLMLAIEQGANVELLDKLLLVNPQVFTHADRFGWTPIHHAAAHQMRECLTTLLALAAARPEVWTFPDAAGRTPLDLRHPELRGELPGSERGGSWPAPRTWDSTVQWSKLLDEERANLLSRLQADDARNTSPAGLGPDANVEWGTISCYPRGVRILRVFDPAWANSRRRLYFMQTADSLFALTGSSAPIHDLNEKRLDTTTDSAVQSGAGEGQPEAMTVLFVTADTVLDYLRFFCFFVHGDEGPFIVLESAFQDELRVDLSPSIRQSIGKLAHPSWLRGEHDGTYFVASSIAYGAALFAADLKITRNGLVEMIDDHPLESFEGVSSVIDCPIQ